MLEKEQIKGILLDYGGTIDSNGIHWAEVLWERYQEFNVPIDKEAFNEAYIFAERKLGINPIIKPDHDFFDVLVLKVVIQIEYLVENNKLEGMGNGKLADYQTDIVKSCYHFVKETIKEAYPVLEFLYNKYPLVLVSNFYGNINTVLKDFGIDHFFKSVVESAVVGVRKPNHEIFNLGVKELGIDAKNAVVIGDSYSKDIEPGKRAGCQTIWLNVSSWDGDKNEGSKADFIIDKFNKLINIFN